MNIQEITDLMNSTFIPSLKNRKIFVDEWNERIYNCKNSVHIQPPITQEEEDSRRKAHTAVEKIIVNTVSQNIKLVDWDGEKTTADRWRRREKINEWQGMEPSVYSSLATVGEVFIKVSRGSYLGQKEAILEWLDAGECEVWYNKRKTDRFGFCAVVRRKNFLGQVVYEYWDKIQVHYFAPEGNNESLNQYNYVRTEQHPYRKVPFIRYIYQMDSKGNTHGELAPHKALFDALNQHHYSAIETERTGAVNQKALTGASIPEQVKTGDASARAQWDYENDLKVKSRSLLVAGEGANFTSLPGTSLDPFTNRAAYLYKQVSQVTGFAITAVSAGYVNLTPESMVWAFNQQDLKLDTIRKNIEIAQINLHQLSDEIMGIKSTYDFDVSAVFADTNPVTISQTVDAVIKLLDAGMPGEEAFAYLKLTKKRIRAVLDSEEYKAASAARIARWKKDAEPTTSAAPTSEIVQPNAEIATVQSSVETQE